MEGILNSDKLASKAYCNARTKGVPESLPHSIEQFLEKSRIVQTWELFQVNLKISCLYIAKIHYDSIQSMNIHQPCVLGNCKRIHYQQNVLEPCPTFTILLVTLP